MVDEPPMTTKRSGHGAIKIAFLLAVAAGTVSSFPIWSGLFQTPPGSFFLWSADPYDNNTYFAKMRPGYRGEWLTVNLYDTIDHEPVLLFPFHVLLGRVAGVYRDFLQWRNGVEPPAYQTMPPVCNDSRLLLTLALAMTIYWFSGMITARPSRRLWAMALALFAGGWGRACNTEAHVLKSCVFYPNFIVSLCFYVLACGAFLRAVKRPSQRARCVLWGAVAGFGLGWVHPYDAPPLIAIGLVFLAWRWRQTRRFPKTLFIAGAAFGAFAAAPILYQMHVKSREPMFQVIDAQNYLRWDQWWQWARMLDVYLAAAVAGVVALWRRRFGPEAMFVIVWVVVGVAVINIPVEFQRRMIEGLPIGLAFATVAAAEQFLIAPLARLKSASGRISSGGPPFVVPPSGGLGSEKRHVPTEVGTTNPRRRLRALRHIAFAGLLLLLLPRTLWVLYDASFTVYRSRARECFIPMEEIEAFDWLSHNTDWREPVWASRERSNAIPFLSGNRVFYGHDVETSFSQEKRLRTAMLFGGALPVEEFHAIVRRFGIRYLYYGPMERAMNPRGDIAAFDPKTLGVPVFANSLVRVYCLSSP